jgi:hypothetical protein
LCLLHEGHLQICFSESSIWMFSLQYPTWLNSHLKIFICNGADCAILRGGGGDSDFEMWNTFWDNLYFLGEFVEIFLEVLPVYIKNKCLIHSSILTLHGGELEFITGYNRFIVCTNSCYSFLLKLWKPTDIVSLLYDYKREKRLTEHLIFLWFPAPLPAKDVSCFLLLRQKEIVELKLH